jgi:hypothetical protein
LPLIVGSAIVHELTFELLPTALKGTITTLRWAAVPVFRYLVILEATRIN